MALPKLYDRVYWDNNTTPAINEDNLNSLSKAVDDIDDRVISLAGTIMEDVPQIQEDIEELEEDFELIDEKIAAATSEANRATTKANEAAASVISAGNKALISEGYAKGTQNGTPVGSSSPYYHNNAEYFKEQARSFTPTGYQDLVDDVAEAQEAITDIEGEKVSSNDAYVLRQCKGNMVDMSLVGGSLAWNQLNGIGNTGNNNGVTWTSNGDGSYTVTGTASAYAAVVVGTNSPRILNHVYLIVGGTSNVGVYTNVSGNTYSFAQSPQDNGQGIIFRVTNSASSAALASCVNSGVNTGGTKIYPQIFDLTQLFGSTIADYIYSLEQATAGAGVEWFRQYFPHLYYGYDAGSIQSVNPSARKVVGFNQWDEQIENGIYNIYADGLDGGKSTVAGYSRCKNLIKILPNTDYYMKKATLESDGVIGYYDAEQHYLNIHSGIGAGTYKTFKTPANAYYMSFYMKGSIEGFCINISKTTGKPKNGDYEPYQSSEYAFDSSKQLRGIFYLDANNKLCADGDIWKANEGITRRYRIDDLGTLTWTASGAATGLYKTDSLQSSIKKGGAILISSKYTVTNLPYDEMPDKSISTNVAGYSESKLVLIKDSTVADATALTTALSGVYLVSELATPTTESAAAYQNPQRAFIDGTEEFVDAGVTTSTRDVSIPVGNESEYNTSVVLPEAQDYTDGAISIIKEIVASSSDFADFKTKVAAL